MFCGSFLFLKAGEKMLCPLCKCEMRIERTSYEATGDNSPDTKTLIFAKQDFVCRNDQCENYGRIVKSVETQLN